MKCKQSRKHPQQKFTRFMCLLREPESLDSDPSCSYIECIDRKRSQEACRAQWCCSPQAGPCWKARQEPPDPRHAAVRRMSHRGFSKQHQSRRHCTASILHSQPDPSALLCPTLPQHIPVRLGLIILARARFPFWLLLWGGVSYDPAGTIHQGKARNGTDSGGDISGICCVL